MRQCLVQFRNLLQGGLFPCLEARVGPLSKPAKLLAAVVSAQPLTQGIPARGAQVGRPERDRLRLLIAFFAKAIYNLLTTRQLMERRQSDQQLRRLCGWNSAAELPSEATFSRAFGQFAQQQIPSRIHAALVTEALPGTVSD